MAGVAEPESKLDFLAGGGEMGGLVRAHDWAATPLGAPAGWPQPLRMAVRLVLNTRHPMYLWWGAGLVCFYNDAYSASLGPERHPGSLGQPGREVWAEIWELIGPQIEQVMAGGGDTWHENQLVPTTRHGRREDLYWTYGFSPVDDPAAPSGVGGVLVVCTETTATVLAERRRTDETRRQRLFFDQAPGCISVMRGPDHVVDFVNDAHRRLFGSEGWVGQPLRSAVPEGADGAWVELLDRVYATGQSQRGNALPARAVDGAGEGGPALRHLDVVCAPVRDEAGQVCGVFCEGVDVSERVAALAALRESEARFREVANAAPVLVWMADAAGDATWLNTTWLDFTGRTLDDERGRGWMEGVHPDDRERCVAVFHAAQARREPYRMDYRLRRRDGAWRMLDDTGVPRFAADGEFLGYIGSCTDVTEHRDTVAALRSSAEQLRLATEHAEVGLWDVDVVTDTLFWPPRVKAMFGISSEVPVSLQDFYAGLHPDDRDATAAAFAAAADPARRALYDVEYRTIGKEDGAVRWIAAKGRAVFDAEGRCVRLIGTAMDIGRRKHAEALLRESESRLAASVATLDGLIESAPIGFAFFDLEHRYLRVNRVLAQINGLPAEAHVGRHVNGVVPADAGLVVDALDLVVASGRAVDALEIDGHSAGRPDEPRSWLTSFFPVRGADGRIDCVGATVVDITERRRAEAAVRSMNQTLEAQVAARTAERDRVWRNSRDLLAVIGPDGLVRAASPSWAAILGHAPADVVGRPVADFIVPAEGSAPDGGLSVAAAPALGDVETRCRHVDGSERRIAWRTAVEEGEVFAYGRDISDERKKDEALARAEAGLRQAQKMEAVGQLTGGIAHDFNNLLQGLSGSLELIRRRPDDPAKVRRWADAGLRAAQRGAKLTGQLLAFSRSQALELKPLHVSELVTNLRELLNRTLGPSVRVRLDLDDDGARALGDATQLEMAVLNLAINARDAMPNGGELTLATRRVRIDGDAEVSPGDYVRLAVADTGQGMPPQVVARAFDPFFTTKPVGKGTGLGLSQVYGMVRQAGGTVRIESVEGAGTTVSLLLPRSSADVEAAAAEAGPGHAAGAPPAATVLVIDDDPDVRRFLVDSVDALGYRAVEADGGEAGLAALERSSPDVLIVDYAMPGLTGADVAREVRRRRPALPIVMASGFADTAAIREIPGAPVPMLRKPFAIEELRAVLADALRRGGEPDGAGTADRGGEAPGVAWAGAGAGAAGAAGDRAG